MKGDPDVSGSANSSAVMSSSQLQPECSRLVQDNRSLSASLAELKRELAAHHLAVNQLQARNLALTLEVTELQCRLRSANQRLLSAASVAQSMAAQAQLLTGLLTADGAANVSEMPVDEDAAVTISDSEEVASGSELNLAAPEPFRAARLCVPLVPDTPDVTVSNEDASDIRLLLESFLADQAESKLCQLIRRIIRAVFTANELMQTSWYGRVNSVGVNGVISSEADPKKKHAIMEFLRVCGVPCDNSTLAKFYRGISCLHRRTARLRAGRKSAD